MHQAPRAWYSRIDEFFQQLGFVHSENKVALYKKDGRKCVEENGGILLLCIYVDDIVYMSSSKEMVTECKATILHTYSMIDLILLSFFLRLEIKQQKGSVLSHRNRMLRSYRKGRGCTALQKLDRKPVVPISHLT